MAVVTKLPMFQFASIPDREVETMRWLRASERRLPTISKNAKDYLSIQSTSVASECTFSESRQLKTSRRACLSDDDIEASVLCRILMCSDLTS